LKIVAGVLRGQSSETKPTSYRKGTRFEELDTGRIYTFDGSIWRYWGQTEEAKNYYTKQNNGDGSPLIRLTGDEFAINSESSLYLLENLNSAIGGGALTNNNGVTFVEDGDIPLRGYTVANLASASSQYLSRATESQFEVGTESFMVSIFAKSSFPGVSKSLFTYGSAVSGKKMWRVYFTAGGMLEIGFRDGVNTVSATITNVQRFFDNRWHNWILLVDRNINRAFVFCDGEILNPAGLDISTIGSLTEVGENLYIGAKNNTAGTIDAFWDGALSNFHLIKAADYNALKVLNYGLRERCCIGGWLLAAVNLRLRSRIQNLSDINDGNYITTIVDLEDGEYDINFVTQHNVDRPIVDLFIDNVKVLSVDMYAAASTSNVRTQVTGIKLSAGKHLLQTKTNGKNASSNNFAQTWQWIDVIKRNGHENGGANSFLLLGDELIQRENAAWSGGITSVSGDYYSNRITEDTNGDYTEGDLFLRGGLWQIEIGVRENTANAGKIDLDFGNVEVFDQLATNASTNLVIHTRLVRLQQGKQNVRLAVVTGTGTPVVRISHIRGVRISD
jgi:hypothetical protein